MTDDNSAVYQMCENNSLVKNYIEKMMSGRRWMLEGISMGSERDVQKAIKLFGG